MQVSLKLVLINFIEAQLDEYIHFHFRFYTFNQSNMDFNLISAFLAIFNEKFRIHYNKSDDLNDFSK